MATLEQANTYNELRGNELWSDLEAAQARALLQDADDYVRGVYGPIRTDLTTDEQRMFDGIVCRLASIFQTKPPAVAATAAIKKESKEGANIGKKETEYFEGPSDPYPYITAVIAPFRRAVSATGTFYMGPVVA